ncbi:MAG TPA: hypothetical protein VLR26_16715 [Frankiaceae bacterium]|nr:hypothetical protein [Frankiaceae bacterium]
MTVPTVASPGPTLLLAPARPPDRLGEHLLFTVVVVLVIALGYLAMWRGWRRRARRVQSLPPLPELASPRPEPLPDPLVPPMPGVYIGSVGAGGWQDRIAGRGLGRRAGGDLVVTDQGVDLAGLWLPRTALAGVRIGPGLANKVVPGPGMVIVGWDWDGTPCESAFRGQASRYPEIVTAVESLLTGAPC